MDCKIRGNVAQTRGDGPYAMTFGACILELEAFFNIHRGHRLMFEDDAVAVCDEEDGWVYAFEVADPEDEVF
jgi:hypothetical protein